MNYSKTTTKAFTLTDILMSLFVISVIIGAVFFIFNILFKQILIYKAINEPIAELNRFSYLLNKDIFESKMIDKNGVGLLFYYSSTETISWKIDKNFIIREDLLLKDTLKIPIKTIKLDTIKDLSERYVCQQIIFEIDFPQKSEELRFYKILYPSQLLNTYKL